MAVQSRDIDPDALIARLAQPIDRIRRRYGLELDIARELVQEVLLRLLKIEKPIHSLEGLFLRAYRNECKRWRDRRDASGTRNLTFVESQAAGRKDRRASGLVLERELRASIDKLRPRDRGFIIGRFFLGLPPKELAVKMGVQPSSVTKLLARAVDRLRQVVCRPPTPPGND